MSRRKTSQFYANQVAALAGEGQNPAQIFRVIQETADAAHRDDWPSERTVRRLFEEHQKLSKPLLREHSLFSWPETFEIGLLPWEAARAALDLVRYCDENGLGRPTIRHCKWFWYMLLASPTIPIDYAVKASGYLWAREYLKDTGANEDVDVLGFMWTLAYQPWRSEGDKTAHEAAARRLHFDPNAIGLGLSQWGHAEAKAIALGDLNLAMALIYGYQSEASSPNRETGDEDDG